MDLFTGERNNPLAQLIVGIDLGSFAVKVVTLDVSFRGAQLKQVLTAPVMYGPENQLQRSLQALATLALPHENIDSISVGYPGERVLLRLLEVPMVDPKKIAAIVGNELADQIPWEVEDVVYDYSEIPIPQGQVLTAAARSDEVSELLKSLTEMGLDPRALAVAPLAYARLLRRIDAGSGTTLLIDMGHQRTNLCLIHEGRACIGRTLSRAGHHLTEAFRQVFQVSYHEAGELKEQHALLNHEAQNSADQSRRQLALMTSEAMAPLIRDIRMSMGVFSSAIGYKPERIVLCGGTSLINGMDRYLSEELGAPAERVHLGGSEDFVVNDLTDAGAAITTLAFGLALEPGGRRGIDLRQGEFAYKTDRSFIIEKIGYFAVSLLVILIFAALNAYMSLYALRKEEATLKKQLVQTSQTVLGETSRSTKKIMRAVKRGCRAKSFAIPEKTAFDILDFISKDVPGTKQTKLDVTQLDIKPGKTYLKATADSRAAIDDIVKSLEKNPCFSNISTGKISDISEGKKQFTLTIDTECF